MELHYGAMLKAERLLMDSNDVLLRPGSQLLLTGTGYGAGQGPGAGKNVSCFLSCYGNNLSYMHHFVVNIDDNVDDW